MEYILGLRDCSIQITNPLRNSRILPYTYKEKKVSKWLIQRRSKLVDRFYSRRILRNKLIKYPVVILSCILVMCTGLYLATLMYYKLHIDSNTGGWLGLIIAMLTILTYLYTDLFMEDKFPTDSFYINLKDRK